MIMIDDYDWWLGFMIMIYDLWIMIDDYDLWLWFMIVIDDYDWWLWLWSPNTLRLVVAKPPAESFRKKH